jgi:hypothetical protein
LALFGLRLWGLVLLLLAVDLRALDTRLGSGIPRRGLARFLVISGTVTALIWLIEPVGALVAGELPESLGVSTTLVTYAFDIAVIFPAAIITGMLVREGRPAGYLLAAPILVVEALLAPMIVAQTIFQLDAGVEFSGVQMVVMIGGFLALATAAIWMLVAIFRHIEDDVPLPSPFHRHEGMLAR